MNNTLALEAKNHTSSKIKILLVDDDKPYAITSKTVLEEYGEFQVDVVTSIKEAWAALTSSTYDAIVCDYKMQDKDGLQFLRELKQKGVDAPFILFTGKGREEVAIEALNVGAKGYFSKHGKTETVFGELAHGIRRAVELNIAENQIKRNAKDWEATFDAASDIIALISPNHEIIKVNKAGCIASGKTLDELCGKKCYEVIHGLKAPITGCPCQETVKTLKTGLGEISLSGRYYIATASPVLDDNGKLSAFVHTIKDITDIKAKDEEARSILQSTMDGFWITDSHGQFIEVNDAYCKMTGYSRLELLTMSISDVEATESREETNKHMQQIIKLGSDRFHTRQNCKNGQILDLEISAKYIEGRGRFFVFLRDITERITMQNRLSAIVYRLNGISQGGSYLGESHQKMFKAYADLIFHGIPGLCIIRADPQEFIDEYGIAPETIKLLTAHSYKGIEALPNLQVVSLAIAEFQKINKQGVVLLDGLEYLITQAGFDDVYRFIQEKRFEFIRNEGLFLLPIDFNTLSDREKALLTCELKILT